MAAIIVTTKKITAPVRQACTGPYFSSTNTNAAAHRNEVVTNRATAAAAASEVSRKAVPVEYLKSSINRWNMDPPRFEKSVNKTDNGAPAAPSRDEVRFAGVRHRYAFRRKVTGANSYRRQFLSTPRRADQKAEAEGKPDGRQRTLRDDILQRFLDR